MYSIQAWFSGGLPYFLVKASTKAFEAGIVERVIPDRRPGAAQIAFAHRPGVAGVEVEADQRVGEAEFGILLDEVGHLVAGEVAADDIGLGLPDLQQIRAEVGDVGRDQLVADQRGVVGAEEGLGGLQQVVAENIVRGQRDELLALHHALSALSAVPTALTITVLGMSHVEGVAVAVLAAQRVGAGADREEHLLVALGDLHDGQRRGGSDLAEQQHRAVLLDHALRLGRGGGGIDRVFRDQVDLACP